jgi:hypothetical protein
LFHLAFLFTGVLRGVGGAFCMWYCAICRILIDVLIVSIWSGVPMLWFWWWIQKMCIANGSIRGLFMFWGVVGSLYVMRSALKWANTCVSGHAPVCGK